MKPNKTCPNCGSEEIYSSVVSGVDHLPVSFLSIIPTSTFQLRVCASCGMATWFVPDKELAIVKRKFNRE
jgi:ribosomal protein S27AE